MPVTTPVGDEVLPVPGWRHPHLLAVRQHRDYLGTHYNLTTTPFIGNEPEPEVPAEWNALHPSDGDGERNWERSVQRHTEINLIRQVWARARLHYQVGQMLERREGHPYRTPAEDWQAYVTARDSLRAAYAALDTTPDTMWRAALLAVVDAKAPATRAAERWDNRAAELAALDQWLLGQLGESSHPTYAIQDAAKAHGVDVTDWLIQPHYEYTDTGWGSTPAVREIEETIEAGDERIRQVRVLAGADEADD